MFDASTFHTTKMAAAGFNGGGALQTGVKVAGTTYFLGEVTQMVIDSRWILIAVVMCCIVDFRLGCQESRMHKAEADKAHNAMLSDFYRFHRSRAIRRSIDKFFNYLFWMVMSMAVGAAFLPHVGIDYIFGAWAGGLVACVCELSSAGGHFLYIHHITVEKRNIKGYVVAFAKALAVAFARQKAGDDVAESIGEAFSEADANVGAASMKPPTQHMDDRGTKEPHSDKRKVEPKTRGNK